MASRPTCASVSGARTSGTARDVTGGVSAWRVTTSSHPSSASGSAITPSNSSVARVEPMGVVDDEHAGWLAQQPADELGSRGGNRCGLDRPRRVGRGHVDIEHGCEQRRQIACRFDQRANARRSSTAPSALRNSGARTPNGTMPNASSPPTMSRGVGRQGQERLHQAGLADARRTDDLDDRTPSGAVRRKACSRATPVRRVGRPGRRSAAAPADRRREIEDRSRSHHVALTFDRQFSLGACVVPLLEPFDDVGAGEHGAHRGLSRQTRQR